MPTTDGFRRTLVGLKPSRANQGANCGPRFRRTLVGLKPVVPGAEVDGVGFQTNPRGVEAGPAGSRRRPPRVSDEPSWG